MLKHLLIVEDDEVTAFLTETVVDTSGLCERRTTVKHGLEALELLSDQAIDLILLDMSMPVLDGVSFLRKKRELQLASVPVVMLTSSDREEDKKTLSDFDDVVAYEVKPLSIERFTAIINDLFQLAK